MQECVQMHRPEDPNTENTSCLSRGSLHHSVANKDSGQRYAHARGFVGTSGLAASSLSTAGELPRCDVGISISRMLEVSIRLIDRVSSSLWSAKCVGRKSFQAVQPIAVDSNW